MDKLLRNLLIGLAVLIVALPIGLLAVGTAYGEWSNEELQGLVGFVPAGLASLSSLWSAPLPNYALPIPGGKFPDPRLAYWLSAIIGVILAAGVLILIGRVLTRDNSQKKDQR